jgi:hypothetical protein
VIRASAEVGADLSPEKGAGRRAVTRAVFGVEGSLASNVYGTIVVMATLAAASGSEIGHSRIAAIVAGTAVVFWLAHVYAHGLSESLELGQRLSRSELAALARRELGIVYAAILPIGALLLGTAGILRETTSVWLALSMGIATLVVWGARYARLEGLAAGGTAAVIASNVALGLLVIALKAFVVH